jgi:hypothetical protein
MRRSETWPFSLADWEATLAQDVPWTLLMSSHLGELQADLRGLVINRAYVTSGIGNIRVVCPVDDTGTLYIRSTFGDIQLIVMAKTPVLVRINASPFTSVVNARDDFRVDKSGKYYASPAYRPDEPHVEVTAAAIFGSVSLILTDD